jgi:type I restriction-modification system DNA methylase subunit
MSTTDLHFLKYSELSYSLTKQLNKTEKQKHGIYFTPPETIQKIIDYLQPFMNNVQTVLEPSCGSCEFMLRLQKAYPNIHMTGIELHQTIFDSIQKCKDKDMVLLQGDYLTYQFDNKFDLIIGNPPFNVLKKNEVHKSYHCYFDGRPNIFILFIIKSLSLLSDGGIMSFVLPKNFLNCLYYEKTRKYISTNYTILNIIDCSNDRYIDTQQDTIILILQKRSYVENDYQNNEFAVIISDNTIFGTKSNIEHLNELCVGSKTLFELGFSVTVGTVVWNQCKKDLCDDASKTLLIYSSDIRNNKLMVKQYSNKDKRNYINKKGYTDPLLVINRGYGMGSYSFNYCIINENEQKEYLIENHLICIRYIHTVSKEELIDKYKHIVKSFKNKKTIEFIKLYFGNNAMNTTEMSKILPIYDI